MSSQLVRKTTIISRNDAAQICGENKEVLSTNRPVGGIRGTMPPPSLIARNRVLKTPATIAQAPAPPSSRVSNQTFGIPSSIGNGRLSVNRKNPIPSTVGPKFNTTKKTTSNVQTPSGLQPRITAQTNPRIASSIAPLNSRSPSVLSSVSSSTTNTTNTTSTKRPLASRIATANNKQNGNVQNSIPDTNTIRKGLAKFSNPIECQRQFQALSLKIRQTSELVEARDKEIESLQAQRLIVSKVVVGLATTVQYYAAKLKIDCEQDLETECATLKSRVEELVSNEKEYENKLEAIVDDYKNHLKVEHDLKNMLERELEDTRSAHSESTKKLVEEHENELNDLNELHSSKVKELEGRIENLQTDLDGRCKDLSELRKEHELLNSSFNKLEESLTKDKDARVKYAQEKISQLQKDVESLNSVLEMRSERIHSLEKDSLALVEAQNELVVVKDANKALNQQLESLNAALEKRREQSENLIVEHEKIRQELKRERKERRRMTMRTEQLEYVLNESCATESNMGFNSSIRDLDSADHIV